MLGYPNEDELLKKELGSENVAKLGKWGRPKKGEEKGNNVTFNRGNSAEYWKARIERDRPDIFARLSEFESVRAAAIEAGIIKQLSRRNYN